MCTRVKDSSDNQRPPSLLEEVDFISRHKKYNESEDHHYHYYQIWDHHNHYDDRYDHHSEDIRELLFLLALPDMSSGK